MKSINLADPNLDVEQLLYDIFEYLLKLESTNESVKQISTKTQRYPWNKEDRTIQVNTYDDANKTIYHKLYFNGESDSNQTKYEVLSNNLHIAVSAKSQIVGKCLHVFLRQIIDKHDDNWFLCWFEDDDTPAVSSFKDIPSIVTTLASLFENYGHCHDIKNDGIYVKTTLRSYNEKDYIMRFIGDVDIWNIYRIGSTLGIWSENEREWDLSI